MQNVKNWVDMLVHGEVVIYDGYQHDDAYCTSTDGYVDVDSTVRYTYLTAKNCFQVKVTVDTYYLLSESTSTLVDPANKQAFKLEADREYFFNIGRNEKVFSWVSGESGVLFLGKMEVG